MPGSLPLDDVYRRRFANREARREAVWDILCRWFDQFIPDNARVLDIACGHGEFANHLPRRNRTIFAADINPDARSFLRSDVAFLPASAEAVDLPDGSLEVVFASNFFEHLPSAEALLDVLHNVGRMLKLNECSTMGGGTHCPSAGHPLDGGGVLGFSRPQTSRHPAAPHRSLRVGGLAT